MCLHPVHNPVILPSNVSRYSLHCMIYILFTLVASPSSLTTRKEEVDTWPRGRETAEQTVCSSNGRQQCCRAPALGSRTTRTAGEKGPGQQPMRRWHISGAASARATITVTSWSAACAMCCTNTRTRSIEPETCGRQREGAAWRGGCGGDLEGSAQLPIDEVRVVNNVQVWSV